MTKTLEEALDALILENLDESVDEAFRRFEEQGGKYDPVAGSETSFNEWRAMLDAFEDMHEPCPAGEDLVPRGV